MGSVRFIFGRAGSGKTVYCLNRITRELKKSPLKGNTLILLVPEQATYQMERTLAGWRGLRGFTRAKVLSFRRLAQMIANEVGSAGGRFLLYSSRKVILTQVISAIRDKLRYWHRTQPEILAGTILKLLDELISANITLESLKEKFNSRNKYSSEFNAKLHDIILILERYNQFELPGLTDPQIYINEYQALIDKVGWLKDTILFVDGFAGFTGQEYAILTNIIKVAPKAYITLCLDAEFLNNDKRYDYLYCFGPTEKTYQRLVNLFNKFNIAIEKPIILKNQERRRFRKSKALASVEKKLAERIDSTLSSDDFHTDHIDIIEADSPFDEVELVAGKILELVRERNYKFKDISVILRNLDRYGYLLTYTFDKYQIPYFVDLRRSIDQHPLSKFIISAIRIIETNYESDWVIRYGKTGLANIDEAEADLIENYVLAHGINNEDWKNEWRYKPEWIGREDQSEDELEELPKKTQEEILNTLNSARKKIISSINNFKKLVGLGENTKTAEFDVNTLIDGILAFLSRLEVSKKLAHLAELQADNPFEKQIHKQILDVVLELFNQLKVVFAGRLLSLTEFREILERSFADQTVGIIPSCIDQVLIGTIERSRHPAVKSTFILDYSEGVWPEPIKEDVLLNDVERKNLECEDLQLTGDIEEHFLREQYLNYIALTRPSEYLWISYSRTDSKGLKVQPSRFLKLITEMGISKKSIPALSNHLLSNASPPLTKHRFIRDFIRIVQEDSAHNQKIMSHFVGVFSLVPELEHIRKRFFELAYDRNVVELNSDLADSIFSDIFSFSRLETFYKCPFQHFCRYGLKLKEKTIYKLEPADLGTLRHKVLKTVWENIIKSNLPWNEISGEKISELVNIAIEEHAKELKNELLLKEPRNEFILEIVKEELKLAVASQIEDISAGRFIPSRFEEKFTFNVGTYQVTGRIDRIDIADNKWALVIDYKSGKPEFSFEELEAGIALQLPGYLLAVLQRYPQLKIAGALMLGLKPNVYKSSKFGVDGFINEDAISAFNNNDTDATPYDIKFTKNGKLYNSMESYVISNKTIESILDLTHKHILNAFDKIKSGNIDIFPFYRNKQSACHFCSYKTICRFKQGIHRYNVLRSAK